MHRAINLKDDIDRLYILRKEGERGLASMEDFVNTSTKRLENYIKKSKEKTNHDVTLRDRLKCPYQLLKLNWLFSNSCIFFIYSKIKFFISKCPCCEVISLNDCIIRFVSFQSNLSRHMTSTLFCFHFLNRNLMTKGDSLIPSETNVRELTSINRLPLKDL